MKTRFTHVGIEPDQASDIQVLTLLLKLICHAQFFLMSDVNRRAILLAISNCVAMLSERSRYMGEAQRFIEGYEQDEKSVWRDLIFLRKLDGKEGEGIPIVTIAGTDMEHEPAAPKQSHPMPCLLN